MIHRKKVLLSLALTAVAMAAHADIGSKELEVRGAIRTPVCTVKQSGDGVYDYGRMPLSIVPQSGHLELTPQTQTWSVHCGEGKTYVSFKPVDLQAGTASRSGVEDAGLGRMDGRPKSMIGYYNVTMSNAVVDTEPKSVAVHDTDNTVFLTRQFNINLLHRSGVYSWGNRAAETNWVPAEGNLQLGSNFEMDITVKPFLASKTVMGDGALIAEAVQLDGHMLFVYSFGL